MNLTYHGVPQRYFEALDPNQPYLPAEYAADGFIHCTDGREAVSIILTLNYRNNPEPFVVLYIDKEKVTAPVRYEDPGRIYPHIYGPLNRDAIVAVRPVARAANGTFHMPARWFHLRPAAAQDVPRLVQIQNQHAVNPTTPAAMEAQEQRDRESGFYLRLVAEDESGRVLGFTTVCRAAWRPEGTMRVQVYVAAEFAAEGVGAALYAAAEQGAREHGAVQLDVTVRDDREAGRAFAERHGFVLGLHAFQSQMDLATFDPARFRAYVTEAERRGYRFVTLAQAGDTEENRRRLYALDMDCTHDEPGMSTAEHWPPVSFEKYCLDVFPADSFDPAAVVIAEKDGQWVASSTLQFPPGRDFAYVAFTGVQREHRGQGLAQAVKCLTAEYAKAKGRSWIRTNNNELNAPMLAVNRKFGFQPLTGFYRFSKTL